MGAPVFVKRNLGGWQVRLDDHPGQFPCSQICGCWWFLQPWNKGREGGGGVSAGHSAPQEGVGCRGVRVLCTEAVWASSPWGL